VYVLSILVLFIYILYYMLAYVAPLCTCMFSNKILKGNMVINWVLIDSYRLEYVLITNRMIIDVNNLIY